MVKNTPFLNRNLPEKKKDEAKNDLSMIDNNLQSTKRT